MATNLYTTDRTLNGIGNFFDLQTNPQSIAVGEIETGVVNATAGGTQIQWTRTAGGTVLEWITGRSPSGGWTLAGTVTFQIFAQESAMTTNIGARARLFKRTAGGSETEVAGGPFDDGVEFTNGAFAVMTWTGSPTSTNFAEDDRLIVRFYITNIGVMAAGTGTMQYNVRSGTVANAPVVTLTETVVFKSDAANFGDIVGTSFNSVASIPDPLSPTASIDISVGDLVFVTVSEASALTSVGCMDGLGNSYTALNSGTSAAANTAAFFSVATNAGACTPAVDTTAAAHVASIACTVYKGPFDASPLDVNTATNGDATSPYTATATGTLAQADELIVLYLAGASIASGDSYGVSSPGGSYIAANVPGNVLAGTPCGIASVVVSSTSSVTMAVTGTSARDTVMATATFKKSVVTDNLLGQAVF